MQAEKWKTTIDLLCLNREVGHAEAGKIIRFICSKSWSKHIEGICNKTENLGPDISSILQTC